MAIQNLSLWISRRLANISTMKSATNNGLIVGFGIGIPSSRADLTRSCVALGLDAPSGVPGFVCVWNAPECCPAVDTSMRSSPCLVWGTSEVSAGDFTSHSGYREVTVGISAKLYSG